MIDADRLLMELHAVLRNAGSISFVTGTYKDQLVRRIEERLSAPPEALRSEEPDYKTMYLQLSAQHVRNVEELERELELCRAVTTLCCKKETTPSPRGKQ